MMPGYDCLNKKRFSSRRKVDSELAATTSVGSAEMDMGWVHELMGWVALGKEKWTHVHLCGSVWSRNRKGSAADC